MNEVQEAGITRTGGSEIIIWPPKSDATDMGQVDTPSIRSSVDVLDYVLEDNELTETVELREFTQLNMNKRCT